MALILIVLNEAYHINSAIDGIGGHFSLEVGALSG